ncbi:hypothetical protein HDV57DRAFT_207598 [Trichoderma longibrachiatum]
MGIHVALDLGLGTGDWRLGIESRGQWRRAARSQPRPGGRRVANHRARGQRQPAALRRMRRTSTRSWRINRQTRTNRGHGVFGWSISGHSGHKYSAGRCLAFCVSVLPVTSRFGLYFLSSRASPRTREM